MKPRKVIKAWAWRTQNGGTMAITGDRTPTAGEYRVRIVPEEQYIRMLRAYRAQQAEETIPPVRKKVGYEYYRGMIDGLVRRCRTDGLGRTQSRNRGESKWKDTGVVSVVWLRDEWERISRSEARRILGLKG